MWAQRGHKGCTSAGTDARIDGTVKARVGRVIDRGRKGTVRKASQGAKRRVSVVQ